MVASNEHATTPYFNMVTDGNLRAVGAKNQCIMSDKHIITYLKIHVAKNLST